MEMASVMSYFADEAPFVILFVFLLFYVLRENAKREEKYQHIIEQLSSAVNEKLIVLEKKISSFLD